MLMPQSQLNELVQQASNSQLKGLIVEAQRLLKERRLEKTQLGRSTRKNVYDAAMTLFKNRCDV